MSSAKGRLFLIPTPLGTNSDPRRVLPMDTLDAIAPLDCFVAENAKSARAFLKGVGTDKPLQSLEIRELNKHTPAGSVAELIAPLKSGRDIGLLSEAGCPAVADPGANLVAAAHAGGFRVVPLIGPSSPLLALMASGLDGQRFAFVGYLPAQTDARAARLRELERRSASNNETQLWIETPYRNQQVFDAALSVLAPATRLLVGAQLTLAGESIAMRAVHEWRKILPQLAREPTIFGLLAEHPRTGGGAHRQPGPAAATRRAPRDHGRAALGSPRDHGRAARRSAK